MTNQDFDPHKAMTALLLFGVDPTDEEIGKMYGEAMMELRENPPRPGQNPYYLCAQMVATQLMQDERGAFCGLKKK